MRKMAQKMIAIAVAMVIVLGMASVTQMDTLAASYSFEGEAHVQTYGDRAGVYRNNTLILGTTGQAKRLERIKIKFNNQTGYDGSIEYRVHRQTYGWTNWVKNNQFAGTKGEAKRLEGIQIRLTGEIAEHYSIRYRVHIQTYGWSQGWQYDGALADFRDLGNLFSSKAVALFPKYPRRIVAGDRANKSITIDRSHRLKHIPLNGGLGDSKDDRQPILPGALPDADWDNPPKIKVCFPRTSSPSLKVPAVIPLSDKLSLFQT